MTKELDESTGVSPELVAGLIGNPTSDLTWLISQLLRVAKEHPNLTEQHSVVFGELQRKGACGV